MKKLYLAILVVAMLAIAAEPAYALRSGDPVQELKDIKWVQGGAFSLLASPKTSNTQAPKLKAAVFLLTRAANTDETLTMLNGLQQTFSTDLQLAAITPDSEQDAKALLQRRKEFTLPLGVDLKRQTSAAYLQGSILYPMAFVSDDSGKILWSGELADLGEMVQKYLKGEFDSRRQKKIEPMLDELQTLLRGNNLAGIKRVSSEILSIDPGNAAAIRMQLFVLEGTNQIEAAWQLLDSQLRQNPKLERLYFTALDLALRRRELNSKIPLLVSAYQTAVPGNLHYDNLMAWSLLNQLLDDPAALKSAQMLTRRAQANLKANTPLPIRRALLSTRALLAYRLGKVEEAIKLEQTTGIKNNPRLIYYQTVRELAQEK